MKTIDKTTFTLDYFKRRIDDIALFKKHDITTALKEKFPTKQIPWGDAEEMKKMLIEGTLRMNSASRYAEGYEFFDLVEQDESAKKAAEKKAVALKAEITEQADKTKDIGILTDADLLTKINEFEAWAHKFEIKFE